MKGRKVRVARWAVFGLLVAALSVVAAGCGGGDDEGSSDVSTAVEGLGTSLEEIQEMARQYGKYLLAGIVLLLLYYRLLRPLMRPVLRRFDQITEVPPLPASARPGDDEVDQQAGRIGHDTEATQQVSAYRENLNMAKKLAADDPRVVANVVKAWVGTNE